MCSSPCTNINNMSMSTSAKLPSKAMKTIKHPRKVLKIAHVNICSIRNKVHEITNLLVKHAEVDMLMLFMLVQGELHTVVFLLRPQC